AGRPRPRGILANRPRRRTAVLRKDGGTYCVHGVGDLRRRGTPRSRSVRPDDLRFATRLTARRQAAAGNTGVFIVYTDSHLLDESPFRPSNADRSFIVKISRMFGAVR